MLRKQLILCSSVILLLLLGGCASSTEHSAKKQAKTVSKQHSLAWLNGCWHSAETGAQETWVYAGDGYYFGHSVTRNNGRVVFFEQLRISVDQAGSSLFAYPGGDGPYEFPATQRGAHSIVFANETHDYPQRIEYARDAANLIASISLLDGSRVNRWTYEPCQLDSKTAPDP